MNAGQRRFTSSTAGVPGAKSAAFTIRKRYECRASMDACRSRTNADDRLPLDPLGRVEGGDGLVEGRDVADVRPQPSVTHPPDDLTELGTIALDNEVYGQAVGGPRFGRPDDRHQCSSRSNQAGGPIPP